MVVIRLARGGAKKRPFYSIVVADKRSRRDGRRIEKIGYFNPIACGKAIRTLVDLEKVDYWLGHGAQMSNRVKKIIKDFRVSGQETSEGEKKAA